MTACERCRHHRASWSYRLDQAVCWGCYHGSFTPEENEAKRIERQAEVAHAVRAAAVVADPDDRCRKILDRALLIEVADTADEVLILIDEVRRLGVRLEAKR
jgi:hypothetical protein